MLEMIRLMSEQRLAIGLYSRNKMEERFEEPIVIARHMMAALVRLDVGRRP